MFKDGLFGVAMDEDVLDRATGNGGDDDVVVDVVGIVVVDVVVVVVVDDCWYRCRLCLLVVFGHL